MRTALVVSVAFLGSVVFAAGACSLGALDGYAAGGSTPGPASASSGATGGSVAGPASASSGATSGSGSGTGGGGPCTQCPAGCVDISSDATNCGACGATCAANYACTASVCNNAVVDVSTFLSTCAVLHGGEVWCWGRDVWGEIAINPQDANNVALIKNDSCRTTPAKVVGLPDPTVDPAVEVSTGREATCVRTKAGAVYCWGSNEAGMLGHDPKTDPVCTKATMSGPTGPCSFAPQLVNLNVPGGEVAAQIALGTVTACVLTTAKNVYCWGSNASGQINAPPSAAAVWTPTQVATDVDQVAVGSDVYGAHDAVCVRLAASGNVACWGASAGGTLFPAPPSAACSAGGDPNCTRTQTIVPTVFSPSNGIPVTADALSVGIFVGVALKSTDVVVWGSDDYVQSGLGAQSPGAVHFDPRALVVPPMKAISAQGLTTLLLTTGGDVWGLGWDPYGQVGSGSFATGACSLTNELACQITPVKLPVPTAVIKIRSGIFNSAAITQDGKLWMWGTNYDASLGHAPDLVVDGTCPGSSFACSATPKPVTIPP